MARRKKACVYRNVIEATLHNEHDFVPFGESEPTNYCPGSDEKLEILVQRAEAGLELWHAGDTSAFDYGFTGEDPVYVRMATCQAGGLDCRYDRFRRGFDVEHQQS